MDLWAGQWANFRPQPVRRGKGSVRGLCTLMPVKNDCFSPKSIIHSPVAMNSFLPRYVVVTWPPFNMDSSDLLAKKNSNLILSAVSLIQGPNMT